MIIVVKLKQNGEAILETYEMLIYENRYCVTKLLNHFVKMCCVVTCIFCKFFTLLSVAYIYCTWYLEKYTKLYI
jgi:hypothetical protein